MQRLVAGMNNNLEVQISRILTADTAGILEGRGIATGFDVGSLPVVGLFVRRLFRGVGFSACVVVGH